MKNKLITNDSYIRRLIKESIIFNTKKQSLMNWFEPTLKRFKDKLYETVIYCSVAHFTIAT